MTFVFTLVISMSLIHTDYKADMIIKLNSVKLWGKTEPHSSTAFGWLVQAMIKPP